jgi:hypothetical protein
MIFVKEAGSPERRRPDYLDLLADDVDDDKGGRRRLGHFVMAHSHESVTHRRLYDDSSGSSYHRHFGRLDENEAECMNSGLAPQLYSHDTDRAQHYGLGLLGRGRSQRGVLN